MTGQVITVARTHDPTPAGVDSGGRARRTVALSAGWVLWATFAQLARGSGNRAPDALWAEDAAFLNQAIHQPFWDTLLTPHAGYLQVVCRLLAELVAPLPPSWMAFGVAFGAACAVSLLSLVVWFASASVLSSTWARMTAAALVPLLPQAGFEVNATSANLHWFLAYAAFWVLLAAPASARGQLVGSLVVLLAALSDPLAALVLPAALVGAILRRRRGFVVSAAMIAGLVAQAAVHLSQPTLQWDRSEPSQLPWIFGLRVLVSAAIGDRELRLFYDALGLPGVFCVSVVVVALLVKLVRLTGREARAVATLALATSVCYLCVPLLLRGNEGYLEHGPGLLNGSRYTIVPLLLLWLAVLVAADDAVQRHGPRLAPLPCVVVGLLCLQLVAALGAETVRSGSPSWAEDVRRAAETCAQSPAATAPRPVLAFADPAGPGEVPIVVAPLGPEPAWGVLLPCARLR